MLVGFGRCVASVVGGLRVSVRLGVWVWGVVVCVVVDLALWVGLRLVGWFACWSVIVVFGVFWCLIPVWCVCGFWGELRALHGVAADFWWILVALMLVLCS